MQADAAMATAAVSAVSSAAAGTGGGDQHRAPLAVDVEAAQVRAEQMEGLGLPRRQGRPRVRAASSKDEW